ncbi:MAG: ABC transporter ATP-binding protein [Rhodobacteraceae bacterium]|nr:ABC transporter ATP-binding protein [Paracoccaceae bacterium]
MTPPGVTLTGSAHIGAHILFAPLILDLAAGKWTCLLGASGVGKSTILRILAGLDTSVRFKGQITTTDNRPLDGRIALMAQSDLLMPWLTLRDNLLVGAQLRREPPDIARAMDVLNRVELTAHTGKKPAQLSGGQRQRAALARTLMEDRPIILLDEPFSALDARTRSLMQDLAADILADRTVLLVTHDPSEAVRLGHAIHVLTRRGLAPVPVPQTPAPRPVDDPETLTMAADLLNRLRTPMESG